MYILEHDPMTDLCAEEESLLGWFLLSLSHGDVDELRSHDVILTGDSLHLWGWIHSWEEYEEDGSSGAHLSECLMNGEWRLLYVTVSHFISHVVGHG
jgi:hypothetical protein